MTDKTLVEKAIAEAADPLQADAFVDRMAGLVKGVNLPLRPALLDNFLAGIRLRIEKQVAEDEFDEFVTCTTSRLYDELNPPPHLGEAIQ